MFQVTADDESRPVCLGALLGLLLSIPWLVLAWVGQATLGLPMPAFTLFELLTRLLPGAVVTAGLEVMIGALQGLGVASTSAAGKTVEGAMALGLVVLALTVLGALYAWSQDAPQSPASGWALGLAVAATTGILFWWAGWGRPGPAVAIGWALALGVGWGLAIDGLHAAAQRAAERPTGRRRFLVKAAAGSAAVGLAGLGLGRWLGGEEQSSVTLQPFPAEPTPSPPPPASGFEPVPGTRPELTPIADFYRVDINLRPPPADAVAGAMSAEARRLAEEEGIEAPSGEYALAVRGLVERPLVLTLERLRELPAVEQFATLECISNRVGGDLIDTTLFTGARLRDLLELAGVLPEAQDVKFDCADGYTESLPLESALDERTLLCYAMGGAPLAEEHGFPLRLYTPDRFGMKNPKWIVLLELVGEDYRGYWEQRGWSEQAFVKITSVIDAIESGPDGIVRAGGIAFSGARGVAGVEIRVDGGEWMRAELNRAISPLTWVLWRARFEAEPGRHALQVRATDGQGNLQEAMPSDTYPDGATGYHQRGFEV